MPYTLDEQGRLTSIDEHHQLIKTKLVSVQKSLKAAKTSYGFTSEMQKKEQLYKLHLQHVELLKKQIAVTARNRKVKNDLQSFYRRDSKDSNDLRVFCISSE